jgi:MoaA/NifB/PqqE/SkfB family radical SAM enzyme
MSVEAMMLLPSLTFNHKRQHFEDTEARQVPDLISSMARPLSLTFQLTRACNFKCIYCSEPPGIRSRSLDEMKAMIDKLAGMRRIILSGGEPMAYKHFWEVLEYVRDRFEIVVLSTNASLVTDRAAARLKDLVDYVDVTVDGPRKQHDLIRGHYQDVINGLIQLRAHGIPVSVICVYLPGNMQSIHYICQTADIFAAHKVKILTPIPKGMSKGIFTDFVTGEKLEGVRDFLEFEKRRNGWNVRITISDWMKIGQGHAILVEPDGRMVASPVWDESECILPFGDLFTEDANDIWARYPYKENHLKKYLEQTLITL